MKNIFFYGYVLIRTTAIILTVESFLTIQKIIENY